MALAQTATADDWSLYQTTLRILAILLPWVIQPLFHSRGAHRLDIQRRSFVSDTVYGTHNGQGTDTPTTVASFALANGEMNWSYTDNFIFPTQPAGGGFVVFGAAKRSDFSSSALYVVDAASGFRLHGEGVGVGCTSAMLTVAFLAEESL
jgi:hypothetical protein